MKVTPNEKFKAGFKPRSIEITFESQQELDAFGALFNLVPVSDAVTNLGVDASAIRYAITDVGGSCSQLHDELGTEIKHGFRLWRVG